MFCPKCKSKYREGFNICADCGTELIEELPIEKFEYVELTTIAETNNLGLIALAKSILDSEGIKYYINDMLSYIPGCTQQIRVPISDAINAKELLKDIGL
jgi:hypothetical protein